MKPTTTWGGAREGAGRKPSGTSQIAVRMTPDEHETFKIIGGTNWLRQAMQEIKGKKMTIKIDTCKFSDKQREAFIEGWEAAGGYMDDLDTDAPWCCPWHCGKSEIAVTGTDARDWGRQYWEAVKEEVNALLATEQEDNDL